MTHTKNVNLTSWWKELQLLDTVVLLVLVYCFWIHYFLVSTYLLFFFFRMCFFPMQTLQCLTRRSFSFPVLSKQKMQPKPWKSSKSMLSIEIWKFLLDPRSSYHTISLSHSKTTTTWSRHQKAKKRLTRKFGNKCLMMLKLIWKMGSLPINSSTWKLTAR